MPVVLISSGGGRRDGGSIDGAGQAAALPSAPESWWCSWASSAVVRSGWSRICMPWGKWKQGRNCGVPRAFRKQADMPSASQDLPRSSSLIWVYHSYSSLSRFPWLSVPPLLFSDKELKYHGDKLLINTKQTDRSASLSHVILHDLRSRSKAKAGEKSRYFQTSHLMQWLQMILFVTKDE